MKGEPGATGRSLEISVPGVQRAVRTCLVDFLRALILLENRPWVIRPKVDALEAVLAPVDRGPMHVSAVLLAFAVDKGVITLEEGEELADAALDDPQTICEAVAPQLEKAGLMSREQVLRILGGEPS